MTKKILNIGSINIDHVYRVPHLVAAGETLSSHGYEFGLGGKGANQSAALAKAGVDTWHVGIVSKQDDWAVEQLAGFGVKTGLITRSDIETGHAIIQVDDRGENSIILHAGCNHQFDLKTLESLLKAHRDAQYLLLQNEINLLSEILALANQLEFNVVFNPAPMTNDIKIDQLTGVDTLIVNETEASQLTGHTKIQDAITVLQKQLPNCRIVITLGAEGAIMLDQGQRIEIKAYDVDVVDTTAAGDTFVGYLVAGFLEELGNHKTMQLATAASALTVTQLGAQVSIPTMQQVSSFLSVIENKAEA